MKASKLVTQPVLRIDEDSTVQEAVEREGLEARISRIGEACQVFTRGFEEEVFTFKELREACRFLSTLIGSLDRDAGDLCLLASHAENLEQFKPVCSMSRQRWRAGKAAKEMVG